jgi:hypothetical protein
LGGNDGGGGGAGFEGEDGGDDLSGGSGGAAGEDAAMDISQSSGGSSGSGGNGGLDAGRDVPAGSGGSGGQDAARDTPVEAPACVSTADCPCLVFGGHAYRFCRAPRNHGDARANCVAQQMRLVRVDSDAENQWLYSTKIAQNFTTTWLGASDTAVEGEWRWADNTLFWMGRGASSGGMPVNSLYNAWQSNAGEPNQTGEEDCAGFWYTNDRWADLTCTDLYSYICESY